MMGFIKTIGYLSFLDQTCFISLSITIAYMYITCFPLKKLVYRGVLTPKGLNVRTADKPVLGKVTRSQISF
jgi:hypothetical protein